MLAWFRRHPLAAHNVLFVLFAAPLAAIGRVLADRYGAGLSPLQAGLIPAGGIVIGLVIARLLAGRLGIPRK